MFKKSVFHLLLSSILLFQINLYSAAYEASTLHNSVSRSETVQSLFFERWAMIEDNNWNFDFYGKINWVPGFKIYTVDNETGDKKAVNMRLIRTYGGLTFMYQFGQKAGENPQEGSDIMAGFTTTGYHYGLTREATVDRGSAGSTSVSDYKFNQFFDDIFALSFVWKPFIYFHGGILINNIVEPDNDGTMSYFNSSAMNTRWFIASNILSFLDTNFTLKASNIEIMEFAVGINYITEFFTGKLPAIVPDTTVGFKRIGLYNDEIYDAVWVNSPKNTGDTKESAYLYVWPVSLKNSLDMLFIDFLMEFQSHSEILIDKMTGEELKFSAVKNLGITLGFDHFYKSPGSQLISTLGFSRFWDPGIAVHSDDSRYIAYGGFYSLGWNTSIFGTKIKFSYNDAAELNRLVETVDKFMLEWEFNCSFNTWSFGNKKKDDEISSGALDK